MLSQWKSNQENSLVLLFIRIQKKVHVQQLKGMQCYKLGTGNELEYAQVV